MKRLALAMTVGLLGVLLAVAPAAAQYGGNPPHTPPGPPTQGCPVKGGPPPNAPPCHPHGKVGHTPPALGAGTQASLKKAQLDLSTAASTQDDISLQVTIAAALLLAGTGSVLVRRTRSRFTTT